jgi:hypothetical protein
MRRTSAWERVCGRRFCFGSRIFFKQPPILAQRIPVKELDAVVAGLEAAPGAPLADSKQILPDLFLAQQLRRLPVMLGQAADRLEIDLLRRHRQPGQLHVLDHARTHRCHRLLLHVDDGIIPSRRR